ncbi:GroES-like protein [Atractiella rhizophila]|nr:GroES-like protein [Atractiella rhizophila]
MSVNQKALVTPSMKGGFVIQVTDVPTPSKGEVLIKVLVVGLNPMEYKMHDRAFCVPSFPTVLGCDIAGTVEAVGEGVEEFKEGDRVYVSFSQRMRSPSLLILQVPDNMSFEEAATLPVCFGTAVIGLMDETPVGLGLNPTFATDQPCKGKSALVIGGSSSVGQYCIQTLKFLGFETIVTYASSKHAAYLTSLGATRVLDRWSDALFQLPGIVDPCDIVIDSVVGTLESQSIALDCLKAEGGFLNCCVDLHKGIQERAEKEGKRICSVFGAYNMSKIRTHAKKRVPELLEKKVFIGTRYEVLDGGFTSVEQGVDRLRRKEISGFKLLTRPFET